MPDSLKYRAGDLVEIMDDPEADLEFLHNTYRGFERLNPLLSNWKKNFKRHILPYVQERGRATILDVGTGGGDIPRYLKRLAHQYNVDVQITGIDPDPRAIEFAQSQTQDNVITYRNLALADIVRAGESYDFVISNHVLHHLTEDELNKMLAAASNVAHHQVLFEDIERSGLAYRLFAVFSLTFNRRSFLRTDGLTSIRKSFTREELQRLLGETWTVDSLFLFRVLVTRTMQ